MSKRKICPCCNQPVDDLLTLKKKIVEAWWDNCGWQHYDWNNINETHKDVAFAGKIIEMVRKFDKINAGKKLDKETL